jgi:hypothetical protein
LRIEFTSATSSSPHCRDEHQGRCEIEACNFRRIAAAFGSSVRHQDNIRQRELTDRTAGIAAHLSLGHEPGFTDATMAEDPDYISLSKRFESFAERSSDPLLADAYRKLAQTYRALDFWHERFKDRYETTAIRQAADDVERGTPDSDQQPRDKDG